MPWRPRRRRAASAGPDFEYSARTMVTYLALGSNLGDRVAEVTGAMVALADLGRVAARSSLYQTLPEGGALQPSYINAAVRLETMLPARQLLQACLAIERRRGRERPAGVSKAPRILDIDILLYGDEVIDEPGLCVPHPLLLGRPFVRIPLAEVAAPGLRHPTTGDALDRSADDATVTRVG
jgi:2-amino-4-hydroxy-6-hydroxymethyldihydropteridine diphosphokinase